MKIEVEVSDADVEFLKKTLKIDTCKFAENLVCMIIAGLKEVALAKKAGVTIATDIIQTMGAKLAKDLYEASKAKE